MRPKPVTLRVDPTSGGLEGESLVQYVVCSRVDLLAERCIDDTETWAPLEPMLRLSRNKMSEALRLSENDLSRQCLHQTDRNLGDVTDLEGRLIAFAHNERGMSAETVRTMGWLTAFATEMLPGRRSHPSGPVLGRWLPDLSERGPSGSAETIVLGEALLGQLTGTSPDAASVLWDHNRERAELVARSLVAVATRPPGGGPMAAVQLGAQLGERILDVVRIHLRHSPVGFRAMRFVQRIFHLADDPPGWWSEKATHEVHAARATLRYAHRNSAAFPDPYPARSMFLEAVRASLDPASPTMTPEWHEEAVAMIWSRLGDRTRPGRELAYAAHVLWELGITPTELAGVVSSESTTGRRPLLRAFFSACAPGELTQLLMDPIALAALKRPEVDRVTSVLDAHSTVPPRPLERRAGGPQPSLGFIARLPETVQQATAALIRIALLSPDGTTRGRACEALREALVTDEACGVISAVIADPECESWLQEIGAFVLGQLGNWHAADVLIELALDPTRIPAVRHAALWALGDLRMENNTAVLDAAESMVLRSLTEPGFPVEVAAAAVYAHGVTDLAGERSGLLRFVASPSFRTAPIGAIAPDYVTLLARWALITRERIAERDNAPAGRLLWGSGIDDVEDLSRVPPPAPTRR